MQKSLVEKFINLLMANGQKYKALKLFSSCLNYLREKTHDKKDLKLALYVLFNAVNNVKPSLEVRKIRVAGSTYLVPAILSKERQQTVAVKWIIESAENRKRKSSACFAECLAQELVDAYKKQGQAIQKRDQLNKLAEANRVYIRYRWW